MSHESQGRSISPSWESKRKRPGLGCVIACLLVILPLAWLAYEFDSLYGAGGHARAVNCRNNVNQLVRAQILYAHDNDGRLPGSASWMTQTLSYARFKEVFKCPEVRESGSYGYAMNSGMSEVPLDKVETPAQPLIYDSTTLTLNANDRVTSLPDPPRHRKGNVIGHTDGRFVQGEAR